MLRSQLLITDRLHFWNNGDRDFVPLTDDDAHIDRTLAEVSILKRSKFAFTAREVVRYIRVVSTKSDLRIREHQTDRMLG